MPEPRSELSTSHTDVPTIDAQATEDEVLTSEMLVEEVSIDGMCGVY